MTLGDKINDFLASYIRKTNVVVAEKKVEDNLPFKPSDYGEESKKFAMEVDGKPLTPFLRRQIALTSPFYMKGLRKKCRDTFRSGYTYDNDGKKPAAVEQLALDVFNKRNNMHAFLEKMKQDAHVYGDGICLIVYTNDQKTATPDISRKPMPKATPYKIKRMNPEYITKFKYKNDTYKKKGIQHLLYENRQTGQDIFIHPDRILLFQETTFAFTKLGISDIDVLRHVISSEADIDIATGNLLKWSSYGIIHWTRDGAGKNVQKTMRKIAEMHPHIYIGNEKDKLNVENPEAIDPKPFYDYLIMAIAAVLVMPTHILKGADVGKTADASYADYNKDIRDSQELIYKPQLEKLYALLFKGLFEKRVFDYDIIFNPMYVGEMAEAEVDAKRSATAVNLKAGSVIDTEEARIYMNDGHTYLDPKKEIIVEEPDVPEKEPIKPNPRTEMAVPKKEKEDRSKDNKLNASLLDDAGKREEFLQDKRVASAETKITTLKKRIKDLKNEN